MVVTCDIQFENNPEATFYAGQVIMGKITLTADKMKQVKAVTLKINGLAKTRWTEKGSKNSSDTTYWGQVDYMNTVTSLMVPNVSDQALTIEPGIHTFSFACHIPANCPSSFEGFRGHIRYVVQVALVRPWKFDQTFSKPITVLSIKNLNFDSPLLKGAANTEWSEDEGMGDDKKSVTYWGHIDYIKSKTQLFITAKQYGPINDNEEIIIKPGVHIFPFTCHISPDSPSSVESFCGYIRYWIQVTLKRPWKFDVTYTRAFTVINVKDLNYDGDLKLPVKSEIFKIFCCGPCKSDPMLINVELPQTGYVPGQLIPVTILITNDTNARVNEICVRLVMIINLRSTHPISKTQTERKTVSKLIGDPVLRHCKKQFTYLLPVPATPPSCSTLCSLIQISYHVEVEAKMQGIMHTNQCINTPVTIGNVPLQMDNMVVQQQPMPRQLNLQLGEELTKGYNNENNNDAACSNGNVEPWSALANIPPPVYMEASHMPHAKLSNDNAHDYGEKEFTPKYPVFNIPSPTTPQASQIDETDGSLVLPPIVTDPDKTTWL